MKYAIVTGGARGLVWESCVRCSPTRWWIG